jgi:hypothetical protein
VTPLPLTKRFVMCANEEGMELKPINPMATRIYGRIHKSPGAVVYGDVLICSLEHMGTIDGID